MIAGNGDLDFIINKYAWYEGPNMYVKSYCLVPYCTTLITNYWFLRFLDKTD